MQNFQKLVLTAVDAFLDGSPEETNTVWQLPHGIISYPKKTPLPLSLIDSLTFHAKNHLFQLCLVKLSSFVTVQPAAKLPSPATIGKYFQQCPSHQVHNLVFCAVPRT